MPLSNAQKLVILRMIEERKSILFGKFKSSQSGNAAKEKAWKEIVDKCKIDYGFDATSGNDWKYLRGTTWPNWKRDTKNKIDENSKTGNEGGKECRLSEVNESVLNIIGRQSASLIGLDAPEQWTENGFDLFHDDEDETSEAISSISESQQSMSIRRGPMTTTNRAEVPRRSNTAAMALLQILDRSDSRSSSSTIQVVIAGRSGQSTTFARPQNETSARRSVSPALSTQHSLIQLGEQATTDFNASIAGPSGFMPPNSPPPSSSKKTSRKRPAQSSIDAFGIGDELREERLKNLKLHNQLIEVQIDYMKLKTRALQAELEKRSIDSIYE